MWRKISWGFIVVYNLIRMPILYIFNKGKIKFHRIQIISPKARIRVGNRGSIEIGRKCTFEEGTLIRATNGIISIGDSVYINRNTNIVARQSIIIGSGVTIGPNVCIYDHDHNFKVRNNHSEPFRTQPINIGQNVWIGANVIILKGVSIANNCVIGAGTIVNKNLSSNTLAFQNRDMITKEIF
jgi:acetyltransferase-like isoleucine patch superfamily enzyme